ncbi:MAG: type IX secretion system membrane protein PorP/SprF [Flavobacteriales bacterium]|nr:MAG: type IX secretion system membrane protein PorP/SprF [Flavobacteriales bacterium]
MKPIHRISFLVLAVLGCSKLFAQQEVMVSQYMFNQLFLNPAYAGSHPYMSGSLLHRSQWLKVEGAPRTSMMAVDAPLMKGKMGAGLSIVHDQIGVSRDLDIAGHYAYHIRVSPGSKLAFGMRAGLSIYSARLSELTFWDTNDQVFQSDLTNQPVGKFGFGLYWYDTYSYVGLSVPTIYAADGKIAMNAKGAIDDYFTQHYYLHAGRVFSLNESFDLKPSTMIKYTPAAPIEADVNCNVLYRERIWLGLGYRTGDALVGMLEYQVNPMLRVGYAYDMTTSKLRTHTSGSHEVMLGFDFGKEPIRIKTPRYF